MQLVADSGSTKTAWILHEGGHILMEFHTAGMNPITQSKHSLAATLQSVASQLSSRMPQKIYFYGAGCVGQGAAMIEVLLASQWPDTQITVGSDLLGAARACCGGKPGVMAILGTGSNSACSDGHHLTRRIPALGYLLGDEGAGSQMGKMLLTEFFYSRLDPAVSEALEASLPAPKEDYLHYLYSSPRIAFELAGFFPFILSRLTHPQIAQIVDDSLESFFHRRLLPFLDSNELPLHLCGGVALHLSDAIRKKAKQYGFSRVSFHDKIHHGIMQYHLNHEIH